MFATFISILTKMYGFRRVLLVMVVFTFIFLLSSCGNNLVQAGRKLKKKKWYKKKMRNMQKKIRSLTGDDDMVIEKIKALISNSSDWGQTKVEVEELKAGANQGEGLSAAGHVKLKMWWHEFIKSKEETKEEIEEKMALATSEEEQMDHQDELDKIEETISSDVVETSFFAQFLEFFGIYI